MGTTRGDGACGRVPVVSQWARQVQRSMRGGDGGGGGARVVCSSLSHLKFSSAPHLLASAPLYEEYLQHTLVAQVYTEG